MSECGVEPDRITRGLSLQWSCPVLDTGGFSPRAMALVAPRTFTQKFGMLPIRVAGSRILYLGFEDRLDAASALALEQMTGLKIESGRDQYAGSMKRRKILFLSAKEFCCEKSLAMRGTRWLRE